jgi:hypothetical protein
MFDAVGLPVEELHRRRYGPLTDKGLEPGGSRDLTDEEVDALRRAGEEVVKSVDQEVEGEPVYFSAEEVALDTEVASVAAAAVGARAEPEDETVPAGARGPSEGVAQPDSAVGDPPDDTDGERLKSAGEDVSPAPEGAS